MISSFVAIERVCAFAGILLRASAADGMAAGQADYLVTFTKSNFDTLKVSVPAAATADIAAKMESPYPIRNLLHLLTVPSVPIRGPAE